MARFLEGEALTSQLSTVNNVLFREGSYSVLATTSSLSSSAGDRWRFLPFDLMGIGEIALALPLPLERLVGEGV